LQLSMRVILGETSKRFQPGNRTTVKLCGYFVKQVIRPHGWTKFSACSVFMTTNLGPTGLNEYPASLLANNSILASSGHDGVRMVRKRLINYI
jgi:hypothetical protein